MKEINETLVQLTGKSPVNPEKERETGEDVTLVVRGSIYNVVESDNHDGTNDKIYKIKAIDIEIIRDDQDIPSDMD